MSAVLTDVAAKRLKYFVHLFAKETGLSNFAGASDAELPERMVEVLTHLEDDLALERRRARLAIAILSALMSELRHFDHTLEAPPGYVLQADGCYAVERMQVDHWRSLQPREKLALADQMCAMMRELSLAGLRTRHPDWSEAQIARKGLEIWLGDECYQRFLRTGKLP